VFFHLLDKLKRLIAFGPHFGDAPLGLAYAARRETMRRRDAAPYALSRVRCKGWFGVKLYCSRQRAHEP